MPKNTWTRFKGQTNPSSSRSEDGPPPCWSVAEPMKGLSPLKPKRLIWIGENVWRGPRRKLRRARVRRWRLISAKGKADLEAHPHSSSPNGLRLNSGAALFKSDPRAQRIARFSGNWRRDDGPLYGVPQPRCRFLSSCLPCSLSRDYRGLCPRLSPRTFRLNVRKKGQSLFSER